MKYEMILMTGGILGGKKFKITHYSSDTKIFDNKLEISAAVKYIEDYCTKNNFSINSTNIAGAIVYHLVK